LATVKHYLQGAIDTHEHTVYECESVGQWLLDHMEKGQAFCVLDHDNKSIPITAEDIAALEDGEYKIINTPADPTTAGYLVFALVVAVAVIALTPKPVLPQNVNRQQESPNNRLGSRSNEPRPLQRVPDIKGEVLSIPDIAMPTYSTYDANIEQEHGYYCVGRKQYQVEKVRDGDTPLELINGASAGIYYPGNNPNNSSSDIQIGDVIPRNVVTPYRLNQINGLTLIPDFYDAKVEQDQFAIRNESPTTFSITQSISASFDAPEWDSSYAIGTDAVLEDIELGAVNLSGTYKITGRYYINQPVLGHIFYLTLDHVTTHSLPSTPATGTPTNIQAQSVSSGNVQEFTDWAYFTREKSNSLIINVTAPNGMYIDSGLADLGLRTVEYKFEVQEVDDTDTPIGAVTLLTDSIQGNTQKLRGKTTEHTFASARKFRVRGARTTPRDLTEGVSVVDEIKWADCYAIVDLEPGHDFGDVTTIQTRTQATPFATAVKERQLNCIATEMLNVYESGGVFNATLTPNTVAVQSFIKDSIDPIIGNRSLDEIDADGLLAVNDDIVNYFGTSDQNQFSYTYDSTEISFQDYAQQLFNAINCIAYREGSVIKAIFEKPVVAPSLLFTHRSKIPGTERYSRNFNKSELNDGLEFNYVDPETNTTETLYLPSDKSAVNPKQMNIPGIRNLNQATIRASREFNKIELAKVNLEFSSTAEGRYVIPMDVIAVVKGTRVYTEDGEVLAQDGLILTLSQDVVFDGVDIHSVMLKSSDGATESVIVTAGPESNQVVMGSVPSMTIMTGIDSRRTEFSFGTDSKHLSQLWLTQEIDISEKLQAGIKAINYDVGYYAGDGVNLSAFSDGFDEGFS